MLRTFACLLLLAQAGAGKPLPATDITAADVQGTLKKAIASKTVDTPIRTVDAGGHNIGVGLVHRPKGTNLPGGASHDKVSEVYHVLEGAGTLVTGGTLVSPQRRAGASEVVSRINGPGYSGTSISGAACAVTLPKATSSSFRPARRTGFLTSRKISRTRSSASIPPESSR
jgi:hypothetical protein